MSKYGPSRSELKMRLGLSLAGLALMVGALLYRGLPIGPAMFEIVGIASVFFGGTAIWSVLRLRRREPEE